MKILQVISSAGFYGAESMLVSLADALSQLGHEVRLASLTSMHSRRGHASKQFCLPPATTGPMRPPHCADTLESIVPS
jgi:hypothetical protein